VKETLALLAAGVVGLALEAALLAQLPPAAVPALSLLFAIVAALLLGPLAGLLACAALGFGADALSGALLGQHAFLRLVEYAAVRLVIGQFDLLRPLPFAAFAFAVALADAAGSAALIQYFLGGFTPDRDTLLQVGARSFASALAAPLVLALARRVVAFADGDVDARREMRLETKRPVL
jgi:rod shape-determining protein MreD